MSTHTKEGLLAQLQAAGIDRTGTLLMHSSMKSIGDTEGGADTVLDALSEFMQDGLLVLPTHTWRDINADNPKYYPDTTSVCVGILPELFRQRKDVHRSLHPTHSVAALGKDAEEFVAGDERFDTPCHRGSAWGRLLDRKATIILVGVDQRRNTFIHGIEEWADIPGRMTDTHEQLFTILADGTEIAVPSRRHCGLSWSQHFWKTEQYLEQRGAIRRAELGDALMWVCDTVKMTELIMGLLQRDPNLYSDNEPMALELVQ